MKKTFTLTILALLAIASVSAQGYRRWDFTNWSAQTVANLAQEATKGVTEGAWSDTEKSNGDNPQPGNCYWSYSTDNCVDGTLMANGAPIVETEGLVFNPSYVGRRSLAIAVNYPSTSLGEYGGPKYLWLGGGNAKSASARLYCFIIPHVMVGQKITVTAESHKPSEARGVSLFAGDCTNDANQIGESFKPTTLDTYTWEEGWTLPEGAQANEDGTVDIQVYNTHGCHIYKLEVGDDSQMSKVAFLYGGKLDEDFAYGQVTSSFKYKVEAIEANGPLTMDLAENYDAIVISSTVTNAEALASLNTVSPFVPTLNLNPNVYSAWGVGEVKDAGTQFAVVANANSPLYRDIELIEDPDNEGTFVLPLANSATFMSPTLAGRFANDDVMAWAMGNPEAVAIHQHNMSHNGYIYIPYTQELLLDAVCDGIINNAVVMLANTKVKVSQATAPSFSLEYKNMNTNVTIKSGVPGAEIFYTIDGSTPTENSTRYTEPFNLTSETTVKAIVRGDGYLMSEVAEQLVDMRPQIASPVIQLDQQDGKTIVTLNHDNAEAALYYNYSGSNVTSQSTRYTEPITVSLTGRTISAFAVAEGFVNSNPVSAEVKIQNPRVRIDVIAHMDANSAEYNGGSTSTAYYFSWGKNKSGDNGYWYYDPASADEQVVVDPETGEETIVMTYNDMNPEEEKDFENGWMVRSRGQLTIWENQTTGSDFGNSGSYNYATVDDQNPDFPATKSYINLADKNTQPSDATFPYNAYIITTQKHAGPFDIVANIGSITKPESPGTHHVVLQVATDGNQWDSNWQTVGDTIVIQNSARLTRNFVRSYDGTDEVYVRAYLCANNSKVGFYDIYLANEGELSKQRLEQLSDGIDEIVTARPVLTDLYFDLQGRQLSSKPQRGLYIHNGKKYVVK